jgi:chitinase
VPFFRVYSDVSLSSFIRNGIRVAVLTPLFAICLTAFQARAANTPARHEPILVGYFGQWGVYDHFFVKNLLTSGAAAQLDQINYSQGAVKGGRCGVADPNADLNLTFHAEDSIDGRADDPRSAFRGNFHQLVALKKRFPHLKILISLEGSPNDFAAGAQPARRSAFVDSCVDTFIRGHFAPGAEDANLFDGIDVDWEYPKAEDAANYIEFLTQLREAMNMVRPGLLLSVAVGASPRMYPGVDMGAVSHLADQIGMMNYDYTGPWNPRTGFLAPLYSNAGGSVERSLLAYREAGVPSSQLLMGMPFYGYGWQQVGSDGHGLFQQGHAIHEDRPYSFLETLTTSAPAHDPEDDDDDSPPASPPVSPVHAGEKRPTTAAQPFAIYRDPRSQAPWLYDGNTFWTFDDPTSIRFKVQFAIEQHLGGVMAWELSEDTARATLLRAARSSLQRHAAGISPDANIHATHRTPADDPGLLTK